jgi:hypothetical protein
VVSVWSRIDACAMAEPWLQGEDAAVWSPGPVSVSGRYARASWIVASLLPACDVQEMVLGLSGSADCDGLRSADGCRLSDDFDRRSNLFVCLSPSEIRPLNRSTR